MKKLYNKYLFFSFLCFLSIFSYTKAADITEANFYDNPLYTFSGKTNTITMPLSIEFPISGGAWNYPHITQSGISVAKFDNTNTGDTSSDKTQSNLGYFNHRLCYSYNSGAEYFEPVANIEAVNGECSGYFTGSFLNWATHTSLDLLRYSLTGGSRYIDSATTTILQRARVADVTEDIPGSINQTVFFDLFPMRRNLASNVTPNSHNYATNCGNNIYFSASINQIIDNSCSSLDSKAANSLNGITKYKVRVKVCTAQDAQLRPDFCQKYPNGNYKPVGVLQKNSETSRFALLSYLNFSPTLATTMTAGGIAANSLGYGWARDFYNYGWGGVLRANARFIGKNYFDTNLNFSANNQLEWSTYDGTTNMDASHERLGSGVIQPKATTKILITGNESVAQGTSIINYINYFGYYDKYRGIDPFSELLGEAMRYLGNYSKPTGIGDGNDNGGKLDSSDVTSRRDPLYIYNRILGMANPAEALKLHNDTFPFINSWDWASQGIDKPLRSICEQDNNKIITIADINNWRNKFYTSTGWHSTALGSIDNNFFNGIALETIMRNISPSLHNLTTPLELATSPDLAGFSQNKYIGAAILAGANLYGIKYQNDSEISLNKVKGTVIDTGEKGIYATDCHLYTAGLYGGVNNAAEVSAFLAAGHSCSEWTSARESQNINSINTALPKNGYFYPAAPNTMIDNIQAAFRSPVKVSGNISTGVLQDNNWQTNGSRQVFLFKNNLYTKVNDLDTSISTELKKYEIYLDTNNVTKSRETDVTRAWEGSLKDTLRGIQGSTTRERNIVIGGALNKDVNGNITSRNAARDFTYADINRTNDIDTDAINAISVGIAAKQAYNLTKEDLIQKRINYFRGKQDDEQTDANPNKLFRKRNFLLGSSVNSTPAYFPKAQTNGKNMLYIGTNDGMVHGIEADSGFERFAFIPRTLLPKIYEYGEKNYVDKPLMESTPIVRTIVPDTFNSPTAKTILASGMGAGARGVFAIDVSKLHNTGQDISKSDILFEFTEQDDKDMGHLIGSPEFVSFKTGTATNNYGQTVDVIETFVAVTSGYNNTSSSTTYDSQGRPLNSLYLYFLSTKKSYTQKWIEGTNYTKVKIADGIANNGITAPNVISYGSRSFFIYMGDLQGNLWRYTSLITPNVQAIFSTKDETNLMPITSKPSVTVSPSTGFMIVFGTGKYMGLNDLGSNQRTQQALISVHDNLNVSNYYRLSDLSQRTSSGTIISGSGNSTKGWYINLPRSTSQGERIVLSPVIRDGKVLASTQILGSFNKLSCGSLGGSLINVDLLTGSGAYSTITNKFVGRVLIMPPMSLIDTQGIQGTSRNSVKSKKNKTLDILIGGATNSEDIQSAPIPERITNDSLSNYIGNNEGILSWREIVDAKLP